MQPIELRDVINVHVDTCPSTLNNKKSVCGKYAYTDLNLLYHYRKHSLLSWEKPLSDYMCVNEMRHPTTLDSLLIGQEHKMITIPKWCRG